MSDKKIVVQQHLSNYEFLVFGTKAMFQMKTVRRSLIFLSMPFLSALFLFITNAQIMEKWYLLILVPIGIIILPIAITMPVKKNKQAKYIMDEGGILCIRGDKEHKISWTDLYYWRETPNYFLFYLPQNVPHVIQKKVMDSPDSINELRALVSTKLYQK